MPSFTQDPLHVAKKKQQKEAWNLFQMYFDFNFKPKGKIVPKPKGPKTCLVNDCKEPRWGLTHNIMYCKKHRNRNT